MPIQRGLILAAGRGRRLGWLSSERPKCLLPLGGRTLLAWELDALAAAGISRVALVGGYRSELLPATTGPLFVNDRWATTQMVHSLLCARDWLLEDDCVVSYGDIAFHPGIVRRLCEDPRPMALTYDRAWRQLWEQRFADPAADAESLEVEEDRLRRIGRARPRLDDLPGQYMGILKFSPGGFRAVESWLERHPRGADVLQMTDLLDGLAGTGIEVGAVPVDGRWVEVDSESDLASYQERLRAPEGWTHDWRWNTP